MKYKMIALVAALTGPVAVLALVPAAQAIECPTTCTSWTCSGPGVQSRQCTQRGHYGETQCRPISTRTQTRNTVACGGKFRVDNLRRIPKPRPSGPVPNNATH